MKVTLTNMCMLEDGNGRVLVQHRLPKPTNPWCGLTFPGGHVEAGESVMASVVREMKEETGLEVSGLSNCGFIQWWQPKNETHYIVFLFRASSFKGELKSSAEGRMEWMTVDEMRRGGLAPCMDKYLEVFLDPHVQQVFGVDDSWIEAKTVVLKDGK